MRWIYILLCLSSTAFGQTVVDESLKGIKESDFKSMRDGLVFIVEQPTNVQFSDLYYSTREWVCGKFNGNGNPGVYSGFQQFAFDPLLQTYYLSKSVSTDQAVPPDEKARIEKAVGDLCKPTLKQ